LKEVKDAVAVGAQRIESEEVSRAVPIEYEQRRDRDSGW
jgi:hypothetical protein